MKEISEPLAPTFQGEIFLQNQIRVALLLIFYSAFHLRRPMSPTAIITSHFPIRTYCSPIAISTLLSYNSIKSGAANHHTPPNLRILQISTLSTTYSLSNLLSYPKPIFKSHH